jgi:2,5-diketo-D-gluconate reductase B
MTLTNFLKTKSGRSLHPVGIGTWGLGDYPMSSPGTVVQVKALEYAFGLGQNHVDTAEIYANGGAERVVGQALAGLDRSDLFIASKIWKNHVATGQVAAAVHAILKRLKTDYLDLRYIHMPWFDAPWQQAIPQIDALIDKGLVGHLGVSNFNVQHFNEAQSIAKHPIAANQIHYSYTHQQELTSQLKAVCQEAGTALVTYLPLEKGALLTNPALRAVADRHQVSPSQIALAWLLSQNILPIPKALGHDHIMQNAASGDVVLTDQDLSELATPPSDR